MTITNNRGYLAGSCPPDTTEHQLYVVSAGSNIDGLLRVNNTDTVASGYSIAHCPPGHGDVAADMVDWIAYNVTIQPSGTAPHEFSVHMKATETLRIKANTASKIIFHLSGNEEVTS